MNKTAALNWVFISFFLFVTADAQINYYVATDGNNNNPGTNLLPFRTIERARDAVRANVAAVLTQDVNVFIKPGIYVLQDTLAFDHRDSGIQQFNVTYKAANTGQKPQITGGRAIGMGGWINVGNNIWKKNIPDVVNLDWKFRQLYNGEFAQTRSREPDFNLDAGVDYGIHEETIDPFYSSGAFGIWGEQIINSPTLAEVSSFGGNMGSDRTIINCTYNFPSVPAGENCEIVTMGPWSSTRAIIDSASGSVVFAGQRVGIAGYYWQDLVLKRDFYLEHAKSFLDTNGEWYLDYETGDLYLRYTVDPNTQPFWAPFLTQLVTVDGTAAQPVKNFHLRNLIFQGTNWEVTEDGYVGNQAHIYRHLDGTYQRPDPAAIQFRNVRDSSVRYCTVRFTGSNGVAMDIGCRDSNVEFNTVHDIGGSAIVLGHIDDFHNGYNIGEETELNSTTASSNLHARSNNVYRFGRDLLGAVGIWGGFVPDLDIRKNTVNDGHYSGINIGWDFTDNLTRLKDPRTIQNHVYDVMKSFHDGSGIYNLGNQNGGLIRENYVHDIANGNGLQFDIGTSFVNVTRNLVHDVGKYGIVFNPGYERNVYNNIFAFVDDYLLNASQRDFFPDDVAFSFHGNIYYDNHGGLAMISFGDQDLASTLATYFYNMYYTTDGTSFFFESYDFDEWTNGPLYNDFGSFDDENPFFVNPGGCNFNFSNPMLVNTLIGFQDWSKYAVGHSGNAPIECFDD